MYTCIIETELESENCKTFLSYSLTFVSDDC